MQNLLNWFIETFPPKEFMLRSNGGMRYFKVGTTMQIILISLLITSGCLVALFTYKMQFLQTVNYKQNLALKDLRKKYMKFTNTVVALRDELGVEGTRFDDTDLNVELQIKKVTKLLEILELDVAAVNKNVNIKKDHRLAEVKSKLENIISEKQDRERLLIELDNIIDSLRDNIDKIYKTGNEDFYIDSDFATVYYKKDLVNNLDNQKNTTVKVSANLTRTIDESRKAMTELKMLNYDLVMKKEERKFFYDINKSLKKSTLEILEERISFMESIFKRTRMSNLTKINTNQTEKEIGGPLQEFSSEDGIVSSIFEKSNQFEILRNRLLSVPLSSPIKKYYITSGYGVRLDPYTKRRAFHNGIDLGAPWGSSILVTAAGKVSFVGRYGSYGKSVFVNHGFGVETRYAHLSKIFVKKGQELKLGDEIGKIGNTGRSTGKHLHYEIKKNKKSLNPRPFLRIGKNVSKKY